MKKEITYSEAISFAIDKMETVANTARAINKVSTCPGCEHCKSARDLLEKYEAVIAKLKTIS